MAATEYDGAVIIGAVQPRIGDVVFAAALLSLAGACGDPQRDDTAYEAGSAPHSVTGGRILFDEGHENFHRTDGRYRAFAELMRSEGFSVEVNRATLSGQALDAADVLVIANAASANPDDPESTFTRAELDAIERFVQHGGGLLLVTDISPWAAPSQPLAARFGVRLSGGGVIDPEARVPGSPSPLDVLFTRAAGRLGRHPILEGRSPAERIDRVTTFAGQALEAPSSAVPLLVLGPRAREYTLEEPEADRYSISPERALVSPRAVPGRPQAVALEKGRGRAVILGEAAMVSAQIAPTGRRMGMNVPGNDNRQFAINVIRWLARQL